MAVDGARSSTSSTPSRRSVDGFAAALRLSLVEGLERLHLVASSMQVDALLDFLALLGKWGQVYNLTAVREPRDMMVTHLLDSLSILPCIDRFAPTSILDVGSGAGIPAIPLAILRPGITVVSVDAVAKKVGFQLQAKAALRLARLRPIHQRVESLRLDEMPAVIVSRAYATLATMIASIDHLADGGTTVLAMKGVRPTAEIEALPPSWSVVEVMPLEVPFLGAARCAVLLRRSAP